MNVLTSIFGAITGPIADYMKRRMELKAQAHQQDLQVQQAIADRKVDLIKSGLTADMAWEMEFAQQAASSWKDEYTLIVVSLPLILAFIPGKAHIVQEGFASFAQTPAWYQLMVQVIFYATYGIRMWRRQQSDT